MTKATNVEPPEDSTEPKPEELDTREPDMSRAEVDKPEPTRTGRRPGRPRKPRLSEALEQQFAFIGMAVFPFNNYDGKIIMDQSADLADSLEKLANDNPRLRKALERMMQTGTFAQFAMAFAPVAIPIMANHGIVPPYLAEFVNAPPLPVIEGKATKKEKDA